MDWISLFQKYSKPLSSYEHAKIDTPRLATPAKKGRNMPTGGLVGSINTVSDFPIEEGWFKAKSKSKGKQGGK